VFCPSFHTERGVELQNRQHANRYWLGAETVTATSESRRSLAAGRMTPSTRVGLAAPYNKQAPVHSSALCQSYLFLKLTEILQASKGVCIHLEGRQGQYPSQRESKKARLHRKNGKSPCSARSQHRACASKNSMVPQGITRVRVCLQGFKQRRVYVHASRQRA
jgi:hypothetical protein